MNAFISKYTFPLTVFVISVILIAATLLFTLKQKRDNEIIYQKFLAAQSAQKEAEARAEKEAEEKIYLLGKFDPSEREDFAVVPKRDSLSGYTMYLRKETLAAFMEMQKAAELDGTNLKIASATRNFDYQKNLWNNKWTGAALVDGKNLAKSVPDGLLRFKKILEYSAVPGASRHHWGTDIDINEASPEYFETAEGKKEYAWLAENAWKFGFCQPYNLKDDDRPEGYNEEKWHWSYLPLAINFTQEYKNLITEMDIKGFDGDQYIPQLDLVNSHILGINPDCL